MMQYTCSIVRMIQQTLFSPYGSLLDGAAQGLHLESCGLDALPLLIVPYAQVDLGIGVSGRMLGVEGMELVPRSHQNTE